MPRGALARAGREVASLAQGHSGNVVLGVVSTGKYFAPFLVATFMAGPLGLLAWLIVRERRARASGWTSKRKAPAG